MNIIISNNAENLQEELSNMSGRTATVEAEYGSVCVEGTVLTLAHHGERSGNPVPCTRENNKVNVDVIGVSHIDLDALGGIMSILGNKPENDEFWNVAGMIDINGIHKLGYSFFPSRSVLNALNAYYAFNEKNRIRTMPERDGSVTDITGVVSEYIDAITAILAGDETLLEDGRQWFDEQQKLDFESFVSVSGDVVIRKAATFVNHLYKGNKVVIALNTEYKSVTISLADPIEGINCCQLVQELWGPEAGGHAGIAGSPRGQEMTMEDVIDLAELVKSRMKK